jgi:hypothetical protein
MAESPQTGVSDTTTKDERTSAPYLLPLFQREKEGKLCLIYSNVSLKELYYDFSI